jgi:carboxypeptidase Q
MREIYSQLIESCMDSDNAMRLLIELCDDIGPRFSGSPDLDKAIDWSIQIMNEIGIERTWKQPVIIPKWVRGTESLTINTPKEEVIPMLGLGMSVGTPPEGIQGEVIVVGSFSELEALENNYVFGKIVLFDVPFTNYGATVPYRMFGPAAAEKKGAVAALIRSVTNRSLDTPHTGVTKKGVGIPGAAITVEDSARIRRLLQREKKVTVTLKMDAQLHGEVTSFNVIGDIIGTDKPDDIVLIGGHLDSWDICPGAQDDGSGCVMCLDALKIILALPKRPKRTIRVVLFTNEENGLDGAREYAAEFGQKQHHFACVESDAGCGIPQQFNYHKPKQVNDEEYEAMLHALRPAMKSLNILEMGEMRTGYSGPDIGPLVRLGIPGFGPGMDLSTYWPIHHTRADTLEKIDPINLKKGTAAMAVITWALANI